MRKAMVFFRKLKCAIFGHRITVRALIAGGHCTRCKVKVDGYTPPPPPEPKKEIHLHVGTIMSVKSLDYSNLEKHSEQIRNKTKQLLEKVSSAEK